MSVPLWPTAFLLPLALLFYYFVLAGARTFEYTPSDVVGSGLAQFSFLGTGTFATIAIGHRAELPLANAIGSGVLMLCSLGLYEWARHTIRERRFHIAWSGEVPSEVCEDGPYAHIRHPVYTSYMIAFAALLVALPTIVALAILLFNIALFTHAARSDERDLAKSELAEDYARYKQRTGMFVPKIAGRNKV